MTAVTIEHRESAASTVRIRLPKLNTERLRILIAHPGPSYSVADVFNGWNEALGDLGLQRFIFNLDDRLAFYDSTYIQHAEGVMRKALTPEQAAEAAINGLAAGLFKIHPHILLSISNFFYDTDMLDMARRHGTKVVLLHTESPYEDGRQLELAPHADLNLINDPTNLERFRELAPTIYIPHAYRPTVHFPGKAVPELACDFGFVGTSFPSRIAFFEAMGLDKLMIAEGDTIRPLEVVLGGNWGRLSDDSPLNKYLAHDKEICMNNSEAAELYRSAKVGINFYRREAEAGHKGTGWACGPREIEMAACGMFFLRDSRPESDELFPTLPTFLGPQDATDQLKWWLTGSRQRERAADAARAAVAERTFTNNAKAMLKELGF